jgi:pimeloyl-ACP methyl ester carboxylesterase
VRNATAISSCKLALKSGLLIASLCLMASPAQAAEFTNSKITSAETTYKTANVQGLNIFYREAGSSKAPAILLLHGFPSSSRMFDTLMPLLADRYHLIAPDYPGFGNSEAPSPDKFSYTFDAIADVVGAFTEAIHLDRYALYLQYRAGLASIDTARLRHVNGSPHPERYNPDLWNDEFAFLNRPGEADIQSDLFYDYRNNLAAFPAWQSWLRERRPRTLIVWGRYDPVFDIAEVAALKRDVPKADVHILDAGHFALDESARDIARLMRNFLGRSARETSKTTAPHVDDGGRGAT